MLLLRLAAVLVGATRRGSLGLLEESVISLRVWPQDCDTQGHMNNGRYLSIMDLGRSDMAMRTGFLRLWLRRRWRPLVGAQTIRYRRPLMPFDRYTLHTRLVCWDEKWIYFEQRFEKDGELYAIAVVKGLVRGPKGPVAPTEMLRALGVFSKSPPMPEAYAAWNESERLAKAAATGAPPTSRSDARMPN